jgi:hypothetical protein
MNEWELMTSYLNQFVQKIYFSLTLACHWYGNLIERGKIPVIRLLITYNLNRKVK